MSNNLISVTLQKRVKAVLTQLNGKDRPTHSNRVSNKEKKDKRLTQL
jgi:hypothetical protein